MNFAPENEATTPIDLQISVELPEPQFLQDSMRNAVRENCKQMAKKLQDYANRIREQSPHELITALQEAKEAAFEGITKAYPFGCAVIVRHHRGSFKGHVVGHRGKWGYDVGYLVIQNDASGKLSKRYHAEVEKVEL